MAATEIVCPMCGFKNAPNTTRCVSCGAKIDELSATEYTEEEERARRHQQEGFEWKWAFLSAAIYLVLQAVILIGLQFVISSYDPIGLNGLLISVAVWFVGGILVGVVSPGKTFVEPAVGALFAVVPTIIYVKLITPDQPLEARPNAADLGSGFELSLLAYIMAGLLGVMISLFGAFLGEKIQMSTRGHAKPQRGR